MSKLLRLGLMGASGRMGSQVLQVLPEFPEVQLAAALVSPKSVKFNEVCLSAAHNHGVELCYTSSLQQAQEHCDVFIDFSLPSCSLELTRLCAAAKKPILIATTGHDAAMLEEIRKLSASCPILQAPNTSLGLLALKETVLHAQRILGEEFQIEISELHHELKRDAPSGTALNLAQALAHGFSENSVGSTVVGRTSARNAKEIGVSSLRGGDSPGEHTVMFLGKGERLEFTHRVRDRSVFARGALGVVSRLVSKNPGLYSMADLLR